MTKCAVDACEREANARAWCKAHYARWQRNGDAGHEAIRSHREYGSPKSQCSVDDCGRTEHVTGYCATHYVRFTQTGHAGGEIAWNRQAAKDHEDGTRTCLKCGSRQPIGEYLVARGCARGRRATCRTCGAINDKQRRSAATDQYASSAALNRARRRGTTNAKVISRDALRTQYGDNCSYCGITMDFDTTTVTRHMATIDHVLALVNGGQHDYPNVVLACHSCNSSKRDQRVETWLPNRLSKLSA